MTFKFCAVVLVSVLALGSLPYLVFRVAELVQFWRDNKKAPAAGFVDLGGRRYKVLPLSLDRMELLNSALTRELDPSRPYTVKRARTAMERTLKLSLYGASGRALRNADGLELKRAFDETLDLYKLGVTNG